MKNLILILLFSCITFGMSATEDPDITIFHTEASYYCGIFDGRQTASGEVYSCDSMTCANVWLPFGTMLKVTNKSNNCVAIVKVNDRGPYLMDKFGRAMFPLSKHPVRHIDLSRAAMEKLEGVQAGVIEVKVEVL